MRGAAPTASARASVLALALLVACDEGGGGRAGTDATPPAPRRDARPTVDAYRPVDALAEDTGTSLDVATRDAQGGTDGSPRPDVASPDALAPDAGRPDATLPPDAMAVDAAPPDAGPPSPRSARDSAHWASGGRVLRGARFILKGTVGPVPQGAGALNGARFSLRAGVFLGDSPP